MKNSPLVSGGYSRSAFSGLPFRAARSTSLALAVAGALGLASVASPAQAQMDPDAPVIDVVGQRAQRNPDSLRFTRSFSPLKSTSANPGAWLPLPG